MVSGGAPLSEVTHDLIRSCIGCSLMQGYGLTETTSCASLMDGEARGRAVREAVRDGSGEGGGEAGD